MNEYWQLGQWRMKLYTITLPGMRIQHEWLHLAKQLADQRLPGEAINATQYGLGFMIVHQAAQDVFITIDWWVLENELIHHAYTCPLSQPNDWQYVTPTGRMACVWELAVIGFERQAWIDCILANPAGPDPQAYLQHQLNADL
jgi:hypothetical protein